MQDLINALTIFSKYTTTNYPTHCEHDILYVQVEPDKVSEEDKRLLKHLSFYPDDDLDCFYSYKYGSC